MTIDAALATPATAKAFGRPKKKGCPYALARRLLGRCENGVPARYAAPGESVGKAGIFIRLPWGIASQFPDKNGDDSSPPHITMLFVGDVTKDHVPDLLAAAREAMRYTDPFDMDLDMYGEFVNDDGATIAHMIPRPVGDRESLERIHRSLKEKVEAMSIRVGHHPGPFRSHTTLAYVPPGDVYMGPKPKGRWTVRALELWVGDAGHRAPIMIPLREESRTPYAAFNALVIEALREIRAEVVRGATSGAE